MKTAKQVLLAATLVITLLVLAGPIAAQQVSGELGSPSATTTHQYKMTTPIAPGVATPDTLETSIGTLNLSDGFPKPDNVEKIYGNLDRSRASQAYLLAIPIVNQAGMRESLRRFGPDNQTDVIWETLVDPRTVELTANDNTIYNFIWIDTHNGPVVLEVPPMSLGAMDNFWYRWVTDIVITGPRRQGKQLDSDDSRQGLVHDLASLWPAGALVQQDLAAGRDRVGALA